MNKMQLVLDHSRRFNVFLAVELPFWISIESGKYTIPIGENESPPRYLNLRNDLWLLSIGNIVDDQPEDVHFHILNEKQIENHELVNKLLREQTTHYHKTKMKTTLTRPMEIIPKQGAITEKTGTPEWIGQVEMVLGTTIPFEKHIEMLADINSLIDYYVSIINPVLSFGDVRRVGLFDVMFRVLIQVKADAATYLHTLRYTHDIKTANLPYPPYKVKVKGDSKRFKEAMLISNTPAFHQIQWAQVINHIREERPREALLSCAILLEALAYQYWTEKERGKKGMALFLRSLDHPTLQNEFNDAANMWSLRNKVVHKQHVLIQEDVMIIMAGIRALSKLRSFFLEKIGSEMLKIGKKFTKFLEPIHPVPVKEPVGKFMPLKIEWLREEDHYEKRME